MGLLLLVFSISLLLHAIYEFANMRDRLEAEERESNPWKFDRYGQRKRD